MRTANMLRNIVYCVGGLQEYKRDLLFSLEPLTHKLWDMVARLATAGPGEQPHIKERVAKNTRVPLRFFTIPSLVQVCNIASP